MPSVTILACFDYSIEKLFIYLAFFVINFYNLKFKNSGHTVKLQRSLKLTEIEKKGINSEKMGRR